MTKPAVLNLDRTRGDTFPHQISIKDTAGVAVNITGFTFLQTVDPSEEPTVAGDNLFQLTGVIDDGPNGLVSFAPDVTEANQTPAEYYHDIQMIDAGSAIRTIAKGKYTFLQDITK